MNRYSEVRITHKRPARFIRAAGACLTFMGVTFSAHATLGGDGASVIQDQSALGATIRITTEASYTDYALYLQDGGVVHEFVSPSSRVFEVTWSKKNFRPNMEQLLGDYLTRFQGQHNGGKPTSRHADRTDADFELHSAVHNRYFIG